MGSSVILPPPGQPAQGPDPAFQSASQPVFVRWNLSDADPPAPLYVTLNDVLEVDVHNSVPNQIVGLTYRMLTPSFPTTGQPDAHPTPEEVKKGPLVGYFSRGITTFPNIPADRAIHSFFLPLSEGFLFTVGVGVQVFGTKPGQTYINVRLASGASATAPDTSMLIAGYASTRKELTWGLSPLVSPLEGAGWTQVIAAANPAAGADFVATVPASARWRFKSISLVLTASAAAASRIPNIVFDDGVNAFFGSVNTNAVTAGQAFRINASPNMQIANDAVNLRMSFPTAIDCIIPAGGRVRTFTAALQGGDQYSSIVYEVEEWIDF